MLRRGPHQHTVQEAIETTGRTSAPRATVGKRPEEKRKGDHAALRGKNFRDMETHSTLSQRRVIACALDHSSAYTYFTRPYVGRPINSVGMTVHSATRKFEKS
jgi:hypothetical protein